MTDNTLKNWFENIKQLQADKQEHFFFVIQENDEVSYGFNNDCDEDYCKKHNIPCYNRQSAGGTIVHAKGTIGINYIYSHDKIPQFLSTEFIEKFCYYLKNKSLNAVLDGNDILIDGFKVASCAENNLEPDYRWCNIVILLPITQNLDLIKSICKKPMLKIPKGLGDYGITTEEVVEFVKGFFETYAQTI